MDACAKDWWYTAMQEVVARPEEQSLEWSCNGGHALSWHYACYPMIKRLWDSDADNIMIEIRRDSGHLPQRAGLNLLRIYGRSIVFWSPSEKSLRELWNPMYWCQANWNHLRGTFKCSDWQGYFLLLDEAFVCLDIALFGCMTCARHSISYREPA